MTFFNILSYIAHTPRAQYLSKLHLLWIGCCCCRCGKWKMPQAIK